MPVFFELAFVMELILPQVKFLPFASTCGIDVLKVCLFMDLEDNFYIFFVVIQLKKKKNGDGLSQGNKQ